MNKNEFRKEVNKHIAELDSAYLKSSNSAIFKNIISLPEFIATPRVFVYLSINREVDTRALIDHCMNSGKQVYLPTDCNAGIMDFALLDCPISELQPGIYNIPVPRENAKRLKPESSDIIVVPALCYDKELFRLGHGGGYYDRYLSGCLAFSVGLCREKLVVPSVPRDNFDLSVDCLVTEKKVARPKSAPQE